MAKRKKVVFRKMQIKPEGDATLLPLKWLKLKKKTKQKPGIVPNVGMIRSDGTLILNDVS